MSEENKDNGNGKLGAEKPAEKTPEQLTQERLERYQKNPETFVELSDIVLMVIRNPRSQLGVSVFMGQCRRTEMDIAEAELIHSVHKQRLQMDITSEMKQEALKNIIPQKHGIMDFVRRRR